MSWDFCRFNYVSPANRFLALKIGGSFLLGVHLYLVIKNFQSEDINNENENENNFEIESDEEYNLDLICDEEV